ncbi:hypothetical protein JD76_05439 [Micromonospora endolithica]|nr:hypothetical protein JD76_05439 [Micromonospora endolithica]
MAPFLRRGSGRVVTAALSTSQMLGWSLPASRAQVEPMFCWALLCWHGESSPQHPIPPGGEAGLT